MENKPLTREGNRRFLRVCMGGIGVTCIVHNLWSRSHFFTQGIKVLVKAADIR